MSNNKVLRTIVFTLILVFSLTISVNAQSCPGGLEGDDCTLVETAFQNTANSQSFNLDFVINVNVSTGFLGNVVIDVAGSGPVVLDGAGNIVAARLDMPSVTNEIPFIGASSGAASFVLVDGVAYFGAGDTLDALTWQSVEVSQLVSFTPTFEAMAGADLAASAGAMSLPDLTGWTRTSGTTSTGAEATVLSATVTDGDLFAGAAEGLEDSGVEGLGDLGAMFEGMSGTYDATNNIYVDEANQRLLEVVTTAVMTMDMSGMMEGLGDLMPTTEPGAEGTEDLGDMGNLLGGMLGEMASNIDSRITFSDFDASFDITAPEGAEPMSETTVSSIAYAYALPDLISTYYSTLAAESMMGDFGDMFGGMDFGAAFYSGSCSYNTQNSAGSLSAGSPVSGTLASGSSDQYKFEVTTGQSITLNLASEEFDTYVELLGPDGVGLASDDDSGEIGTNSLLTYTAETDGTFTAVVCGFSSDAKGSYQLNLSN